jgi:hypothetical protein
LTTHLPFDILKPMKNPHLLFMSVVLILLLPSHSFSFQGPLQVKNQYPIFLHTNQPYLQSANTEDSLSISLSHSSIYTVQTSENWTINLDMELTELNLRYKKVIRNIFELGIDLPLIIFSGGFMDGFLESYHDTFGFHDYGRSQRPLNNFLYEVRNNGNLIIRGRSGPGIGDIRLNVKTPFYSSDGLTLSIAGALELPSGDAKKGYGNGSTDWAVSMLADKKFFDNVKTYWNLGAVFPGDLKGYTEVNLEDYIYGGAAVEAVVGKGLSLIAQMIGHSPVFPDTNLLAVDRPAYLLTIGARCLAAKEKSIEFSITEDINTSGAPDVIVNITFKIMI